MDRSQLIHNHLTNTSREDFLENLRTAGFVVGDRSFVYSQLILYALSGSRAYGTNTPESDIDYRGICIPPKEYLLGLHQFESRHREKPDEVIYSLKKFVHLALQNNPNVLDTLFVDEDKILFIDEYGYELRSLANDFLSKRVYKTYGGYAKAQLQAMANRGGKGNHIVRTELIKRHQYDTKHALHLIRLLRMGIEILEVGKVIVHRPDAQELLAIKRGEYALNDILKMAASLENRLHEAYETTKLPDEPNTTKIEKWLVSAHRRSLK
jgi:predicted nucleotidyltransferase